MHIKKRKLPIDSRKYPDGLSGAEYYDLNREKILEANRKSYLRTKEKRAQKAAAYRLKVRTEEPWQYCLRSAEIRHKKYSEVFDLTADWAKERYTGYCEVSGIPFSLDNRMLYCSIDRIDSSIGYTKENSRFILFCLNVMRMNSKDDETLLKVCKEVNRCKGKYTYKAITPAIRHKDTGKLLKLVDSL